jgi:putative alpha-1,2-mannosidase
VVYECNYYYYLENLDLINSLTTLAEESGKGYYERWEFLNAYSGCMIGNPAISVVADAYVKGFLFIVIYISKYSNIKNYIDGNNKNLFKIHSN